VSHGWLACWGLTCTSRTLQNYKDSPWGRPSDRSSCTCAATPALAS